MTQDAKTAQGKNLDLLYSLHDKPGFLPSVFAALQHVLASLVGVITPTLIVGEHSDWVSTFLI
ncbi:hypothetical protein MBH78_09190 [Oceanimonas sp. NS1]|nr:hypothetical protein [Oceanimonas sp. NS1]